MKQKSSSTRVQLIAAESRGAHMKPKRHSISTCLMVAAILTAVLAIPAAAQQSVPFKGAIVGVDADIPSTTPGSLVVATGGTGTATHLGNFYFIQVITLDLAHGT